MKKREHDIDMVRLFRLFKRMVLDKQPTFEQMVQDVHMMKFKIRPLQGDFSYINFSNKQFVETLWKLGMMDSFIEKNIVKIDKKQEGTFFSYFDSVYKNLQDTLNSIHLYEVGHAKDRHERNRVEMEIFKERGKLKKSN